MPDTFDLDALFAHLESDIAGASSPRGAALSVSTARRRRRTTIGATLAGVAVVAAAVAVGAGAGSSDHGGEPVTQLPAPARLDGALLTAATAGWTPAWGPDTTVVRNKIAQSFGGPCIANIPGGSTRSHLSALADTHDDAALAEMSDFGSRAAKARAAWRQVERQLRSCRDAELVSSFTTSSGGAGHTYRIDPSGSESAPEYAWIVTTGRQVGELKIFGQSEGLPAANDRPVANALMAALGSDASYSDATQGESGQATAEELASFGSTRLRHALGGWPSGWHAGPPPTGLLHEPCGSDGWNGAGKDTSIGADGRYWIHQFSSPTAAEVGYQQIQDALAECADYTMGTVTVPGRPSVLVARGDHDVWAVRHDDWVVVTYLPRAATPPPDAVSSKIGLAMVGVVDDALAKSRSTGG